MNIYIDVQGRRSQCPKSDTPPGKQLALPNKWRWRSKFIIYCSPMGPCRCLQPKQDESTLLTVEMAQISQNHSHNRAKTYSLSESPLIWWKWLTSNQARWEYLGMIIWCFESLDRVALSRHPQAQRSPSVTIRSNLVRPSSWLLDASTSFWQLLILLRRWNSGQTWLSPFWLSPTPGVSAVTH